jgi:heterodisulfide reductase subunit A2
VYKNAKLVSNHGAVGDFVSEIEVNGQNQGDQLRCRRGVHRRQGIKPKEYMYGQDDRVMTHLEFEGAARP